MVDVLLASEDIDVIGGSSKVNLTVNSGTTGDRGSFIFVGAGDPNVSTTILPETPTIYDMYINLSQQDSDYLYLYQYINADGSYIWVKLLRLVPSTYITNYIGTYNSMGAMQINVQLKDVIPLAFAGSYTSNNFNIQHTVINPAGRPVASSIEVGTIALIDESLVLPLTVHAMEFTGTTWAPLVGAGSVHLLVTVGG